jgi:hypothetical protein
VTVYLLYLKFKSFIFSAGTVLRLAARLIFLLSAFLSLSAIAATTYSGSNGVRLKLLTSNSVAACSGCHYDGGTGPNFTSDYAAFSAYATTYHAGIATDAVQRMIERTSLAVGVASFMPEGGGSQISNAEKALLAAWKANFAVDVDSPTATTLTTITGKTNVFKTSNDSAQFTVYANVDDSGIDATAYIIEYGLSATPSFSSASQFVSGSGGGVSTTQISQQLTSLYCGTTYYYRVKASNTSFTSSGGWQQEDTAACNTAPVFQSTPFSPANATEDVPYTFSIVAIDGETDSIRYSLSNEPVGMTINDSSGVISWTPLEGITSSGLVTVRAHDYALNLVGADGAVADSETFTITVDAVNDAPAITSTPSTSAIESTLYSYQVVVDDPDDSGAGLAYDVSPKTGDMTINSSGLLTWTPANGISSSGSITVTVNDGGENSAAAATQVFTITVTDVNTSPSITTSAPVTATEDILYQYNVGVLDLDDDNNGSDINFALANQPSGMTISATGVITWTPLESQGDANNIQLTVTDGGEDSAVVALETFSIAVTAVNDAPLITSSASTSAIESNLYSYQVLVSDPDDAGLELDYQLTSFPTGMSISISGLVTWTPGNGILTSGVVTLEVSDGGEDSAAVALQSFTITVNGVNTAPTISSAGGTLAIEDIEYQYAVQVVDADDDNNGTDITFLLANAPTGMAVSATGLVTWTPSEGQGYAANIQIIVADGGENSVSSAIEFLSITVVSINDGPVITSSPLVVATESQAYNYQLTIIDPDDALNELTFQLMTMPSGMTLSNTGLISWTPANDVSSSGLVTVRISDGGENDALPAEQSFTVTVTAVNTEPMILSTALTTAIEDQLYQYALVVIDEDDDNDGSGLLFNLSNAPADMSISNTGIITWTPLEGQLKVEDIQVAVTDGGEDGTLPDTELFSINIVAVNDSPQLAVISDQAITELETLSLNLGSFVADVDDINNGTDLSWSLIDSPLAMTIDNQGQLNWQSPESSAATYTINVQVVDGGEDLAVAALQSFQLVVNLLDGDEDSIADYNDNCVGLANTDQLNSDDDSLGNACDDDDDNDTIPDVVEIANNLDPLNAADAALDSDGDGETNAVEQQQCALVDDSENNLCDQILRDSVAPEITTNGNQQRISSSYLTPVTLVASAFDIKDGELVASADKLGPFRPGKHVVIWQAQDTQGNTAQAEQLVSILPRVRFSGYQQVIPNQTVTIPLILSGAAIEYPVVIDFDVSGTATEQDHNLSAGQIIINQGEQGKIIFNTLANENLASNKSIIINLQQSNEVVHLSAGLSYQVDLMMTNIAPAVQLTLTQNSFASRVIYQDQGNFTLTAAIDDVNDDALAITWTASTAPELFNLSQDVLTYTFDANEFSVGFYRVQLKVNDGDLEDAESIGFRIEAQAPMLTTADSDHDGIADNLEGLTDADGDGIQDYLDPINDAQYMHKNLLSNDLFETANQLLVTQPGLTLKLGEIAIQQGKAGVGLAASELNPLDSAEEKNIIGEVFDFEIHGISAQQTRVKIVIPLATAIPINAEYWKYDGNRWYAFDTRAGDSFATAFKQEGTCPDTDSDRYRIGLIPFTQCLLLSITDGGVNDSDGSINGVVTDPGAIVMDSFFELNTQKTLTQPSSSPGAGAVSIGFILLLLLSISFRAHAEIEQQVLLSAMIGSDDNVSRAENKVDIISDRFANIDARVITDYEISFNKSLSLELQVGHQAYQFTKQLERNEYSGRLVYRWQNNFAYNSPWYQIFSDIKIWDSKAQQRNSTFYTQQAMVSARLTTKISGSIGLEHKLRDSESRVFDLTQSRAFAHLDYAWSDDFSLYASYSYIKGDTVSTVQNQYCNGLTATSVYPLLLVAKDIEWDEVFNNDYCGNWISYRLKALTQSFVLGANYGFDHTSSLDFSWLYVDVQAEGGNDYQRNIIQVNFLKAF